MARQGMAWGSAIRGCWRASALRRSRLCAEPFTCLPNADTMRPESEEMGNEGFNLRVHCGVGRCRGVRYQRMRRPVAAGCQARANDIEHTDHGANDIEDTDHGANDIEHTDGGVPVSCWRVCAIRTTGWLLHHAPPERGDQPGVLPGWQVPG